MGSKFSKLDVDSERLSLAIDNLEDAKKYLHDMDSSFEVSDQKRHWKTFLVNLNIAAHNIVYACKQKGSIFQYVDKCFKNDPLLSYLHACRNAFDHGTNRPTESAAFIRVRGIRETEFLIRLGKATDGSSPKIIQSAWVKCERAEDGQLIETKGGDVYNAEDGIQPDFFSKEVVSLGPVSNRNKVFQVPTLHLSTQISEITPIMFGRLALDFYQAQINKIERAIIGPY